MNKKERASPATYRELRQTLSRELLPRESFDLMLEEMGAVERIASLWTVNLVWKMREDVREGRGRSSNAGTFQPDQSRGRSHQAETARQALLRRPPGRDGSAARGPRARGPDRLR